MIAKARCVGVAMGCVLWLGFTPIAPARADDSQRLGRDGLPLWSDDPALLPAPAAAQRIGGEYAEVDGGDTRARWVDDPYAPHDTTGANLRAGTAVGRLVHDDVPYTLLGLTVAGGPRMGRFTLEGHYTYLELSEPGPPDTRYGSAQRFAVMGRADVLRFGSRIIGANSLLALYAEAGLAHQRHHWLRPGAHEAPREVALDFSRSGAVVGFGFNLDFRLEQPRGFPTRVGWQLGWQLTASDDHARDPTVVCRGVSCAMRTTTETARTRDTSMLLTSTIAFTW